MRRFYQTPILPMSLVSVVSPSHNSLQSTPINSPVLRPRPSFPPITALPKQHRRPPQPLLIHLIKPPHQRTIDVKNRNNLTKKSARCLPPIPQDPSTSPQSRISQTISLLLLILQAICPSNSLTSYTLIRPLLLSSITAYSLPEYYALTCGTSVEGTVSWSGVWGEVA